MDLEMDGDWKWVKQEVDLEVVEEVEEEKVELAISNTHQGDCDLSWDTFLDSMEEEQVGVSFSAMAP